MVRKSRIAPSKRGYDESRPVNKSTKSDKAKIVQEWFESKKENLLNVASSKCKLNSKSRQNAEIRSKELSTTGNIIQFISMMDTVYLYLCHVSSLV